MTAKVSFNFDGNPAVAVLGDDQKWSCVEVPHIARALNALYSYRGPADGQAGHRAATEAAEALGGTVEFEAKDQPPEGTVY